jgi:hypothetical protein
MGMRIPALVGIFESKKRTSYRKSGIRSRAYLGGVLVSIGGASMTTRFKYPRTVHLPWSPGVSDDDVVDKNLDALMDQDIVITEKMDGENTTLYHDGFHARSLDSRHHPSRDWLAGFHAGLAHRIPDDVRICGENLYAQHSITYDDLPSYFLGFGVWRGQRCLSWPETLDMFDVLGITPVPVLYRGPYVPRVLEDLSRFMDHRRQEGYVVRTVQEFDLADFGRRVRKYVRAGHVQTTEHWAHAAVVPNGLRPRNTIP